MPLWAITCPQFLPAPQNANAKHGRGAAAPAQDRARIPPPRLTRGHRALPPAAPTEDGGTCLHVDDGEGPVCPLDNGDQVLGGGRQESPESAVEPSLLGLPVALQVSTSDPAHVASEGHVQGGQTELGTGGRAARRVRHGQTSRSLLPPSWEGASL